MSRYDEVDFFTDPDLINDPHPYFEYLRAKGAATPLLSRNVVAVTGYDEGLAVFRDDERFSAIQAVSGPIPPLPFTPAGDDISDQIEAHRPDMPYAALLATLDPPVHTRMKSLLMGMITPKRLKENEAFVLRLADRTLDGLLTRGRFEVVEELGRVFATLVIADLLGVPEEDHKHFRTLMGDTPGQIDGSVTADNNPLAEIGRYFFTYIEQRRQAPRQDVLTELAHAKLPDGSLPATADVVTLATFLFGAGSDTTVRMFSSLLRFIGEDPDLQRTLREDRSLIPEYVEEVLRLEGSIKTAYRLAKTTVRVGDVEVRPGTTVMLIIAAMNRDPRRFEAPGQLRLGRKNVREHVAFSRGIHACAGAPLARATAKIMLERLFDRTTDLRIDETVHGPAHARRYEQVPTYLMRGLRELHVEVTPKP